MNSQANAVVAVLAERGAQEIDHPGGNLLDHLVRTGALLRSWGAPVELTLAGLAHAAYGTDGFPTGLFGLDERDAVVQVVGPMAEAIVYRYASCERAFTLPGIGQSADVAFRDRFTGEVEIVHSTAVKQFAELTMANELELLRHSETFRRDHGPAITALFSSWRDVVSSAAAGALVDICRDASRAARAR
jgi:hypothetical protein